MKQFGFSERSIHGRGAVELVTGNAYVLDDRTIGRAFSETLEADAADLLTIAASCYLVDRTQRRPPAWTRDLPLSIPLVDPVRWRRAVPGLESYLRLLTDDVWKLDFTPAKRRVASVQLSMFGADRRPDSVGLFSGGLDSLAGASKWLADHRDGQLGLVGSRASTVIGADQRALVRGLLQHFPKRVVHVGVPVHLADSSSPESTQRTRMFLFLALGVAAARAAKVGRVLVFENGYGALNPRLCENQIGSQSTKGCHPATLRLFVDALRTADVEIDVELPGRWQTKTELVSEMPSDLRTLIATTASCDSYPLRLPDAKQCGHCGSCVLRTQALLAARLSRHERHDFDEVQWEVSGIARLMARQAWQIGQIAQSDDWATAERLWPELGLGSTAQLAIDAVATREMLVRYSAEWAGIARERPRMADALRWPEARERVA